MRSFPHPPADEAVPPLKSKTLTKMTGSPRYNILRQKKSRLSTALSLKGKHYVKKKLAQLNGFSVGYGSAFGWLYAMSATPRYLNTS